MSTTQQPQEILINEMAVKTGAIAANVALGTFDAAVDFGTGYMVQREIRREARGSYADRRSAAAALLRAK